MGGGEWDGGMLIGVIGPAKLEIFSTEAGRYAELAAFAFTPGGENFYFTPLNLGLESGVVLEVCRRSGRH